MSGLSTNPIFPVISSGGFERLSRTIEIKAVPTRCRWTKEECHRRELFFSVWKEKEKIQIIIQIIIYVPIPASLRLKMRKCG